MLCEVCGVARVDTKGLCAVAQMCGAALSAGEVSLFQFVLRHAAA